MALTSRTKRKRRERGVVEELGLGGVAGGVCVEDGVRGGVIVAALVGRLRGGGMVDAVLLLLAA